MSRKLFGTDGIRGKANTYPMTAELALRVGMAAGHVFTGGTGSHRVVIGKDTRLSCYVIEAAMQAGFASVGMDVFLLGPVPTPGVAMLTRSLRAELGVMISASHNPFYDNGIKLFGPDGYKLSNEVEAEIERLLDVPTSEILAAPEKMGRAKRIEGASERYIEFAKRTLDKQIRLEGLKVIIDCAHGAGYKAAPAALWELGAEIHRIGVEPNGFNINKECGSTSPGELSARVVAEGADIGVALDGDADRVMIVDEKGRVIDGDQILAAIAHSWMARDLLLGGGVVATVMSNLGLERYLTGLGLKMERTPVGDRYVVEHMRKGGYNVGGEQSGHIILSDFATTGDGLVTALQILGLVVASGRPVSEVCQRFEPAPQLLRNFRHHGGAPLEHAAVKAAIRDGEARLSSRGRLLIRPSGTEPLIRVMAEGDDEAMVSEVVGSIIAALEATAADDASA
jgi:phosphoglucosamine mutase